MVKADKVEMTREEIVMVTAGTVLGQGLLEQWDWGQVSEMSFGAFPGGDIYNRVNMHAGFQSGGDTWATTSTASAYTLQTDDMGGDITYISWTPSATTTLTFMATTSSAMYALDIPNTGDKREYIMYNTHATVADDITITLAAGTGIDLQYNEDSADLAIVPTSSAKLTLIRKADSDVMVIFEQFDVAD